MKKITWRVDRTKINYTFQENEFVYIKKGKKNEQILVWWNKKWTISDNKEII